MEIGEKWINWGFILKILKVDFENASIGRVSRA